MLKISKEFINSHRDLVQCKESKKYPGLYVLKYKNKVFYDNLWTPELLECRGLVVDKDFNPIVRPFDKIFNYKENNTDFEDHHEEVCVVEKVNGFFAALTFSDTYGWIVSTTGSTDSEFARFAESKLEKYKETLEKSKAINVTWMFEICDSSFDPHIIAEQDGEYLTGCRSVNTGYLYSEEFLDIQANLMGAKRPKHFITTPSYLLKNIKTVTHEGFVVRHKEFNDKQVLKIKSPYYLTTKFIARLKNEKLELLLKDKNKFKQRLKDEEFFPLIDFVESVYDKFVLLSEQEKIRMIREFLENEVLSDE